MSNVVRLATCDRIGESSSAIVASRLWVFATGRGGRRNVDRPLSFRSSTVGIVIPPTGPKVADLRPESMWGDEVECFSARRWRIGGI